MFCRNVGGVDRAIRLAGGAVVLAIGLVLLAVGRGPGWAVALLGAFVLVSGVVGFCPPYVLLGISTAKPRSSAAPGARAGAADAAGRRTKPV